MTNCEKASDDTVCRGFDRPNVPYSEVGANIVTIVTNVTFVTNGPILL